MSKILLGSLGFFACTHHFLAIGEDDYFEKANEFRVWLKESKGKYLDEISSKEARRYFKKFVKRWNDYELDGRVVL